jgi:predicted HTH domain antitoxin
MPVMSVRLSAREERLIQALASEEEKEKSTEARELMMDGIKYKLLVGYKQGKVSLGTLAKKLGMSLSEVLDFLAFLGIPAPISFDDYLQGLATARKLFSESQ